MALEQNVTRIEGAKQDLKSAIEEKGVSVPSTMKIDGYAGLVRNIKNQSNISSVDKSINVRTSVDGDVDLAVNTEIIATNDSVDRKLEDKVDNETLDNYYDKDECSGLFVSTLTSLDDSISLTRTTSGYDLSVIGGDEGNGVTFGYLINGQFYKENEENEEVKIPAEKNKLYVDLNTNDSYHYTNALIPAEKIPELLSNGAYANTSNAKIGDYTTLSEYSIQYFGEKLDFKNDVIMYNIDEDFIKNVLTNYIPKGTHIMTYSDLIHFMAKYDIEDISTEEDTLEFIKYLEKDFGIKLPSATIVSNYGDVYDVKFNRYTIFVEEEYQGEVGEKYICLQIIGMANDTEAYYDVDFIPFSDEYVEEYHINTSIMYVLDTYINTIGVIAKMLDVEIDENKYTTFKDMIPENYTIINGAEFKLYYKDYIEEIESNTLNDMNCHIITEDDILNTLVSLYGDIDYEDSDAFNNALCGTLEYMGVTTFKFIDNYSRTIEEAYGYYKLKDSDGYGVFTYVIDGITKYTYLNESLDYTEEAQVFYVKNDYVPNVVSSDTVEDVTYEDMYVKVSDTKIFYGSFVNEIFRDENLNKILLIEGKLYYDKENELTYICVNNELVQIGGSTIDTEGGSTIDTEKFALKKYYGDDAINLETHTTDNSGNAWFSGNMVVSKSASTIKYTTFINEGYKISENNFIAGDHISLSGQNKSNLIMNAYMDGQIVGSKSYGGAPLSVDTIQNSMLVGEGCSAWSSNGLLLNGIVNSAGVTTKALLQGDGNKVCKSNNNVIIGSFNRIENMINTETSSYSCYIPSADYYYSPLTIGTAQYNANANYNGGWTPSLNIIVGSYNGIARGEKNFILGNRNVANTEIVNSGKYVSEALGALGDFVMGDKNDISTMSRTIVIGNNNGGYGTTASDRHQGLTNKSTNAIIIGSGHSLYGNLQNTILIGEDSIIQTPKRSENSGSCVTRSILITNGDWRNQKCEFYNIGNSIIVGEGISASNLTKNLIMGSHDTLRASNAIFMMNGVSESGTSGNIISNDTCLMVLGCENNITSVDHSLVLGNKNNMLYAASTIANSKNDINCCDNCILFNDDYEKSYSYGVVKANTYSSCNSIISFGSGVDLNSMGRVLNLGELSGVSSNAILNLGGKEEYKDKQGYSRYSGTNLIDSISNCLLVGDTLTSKSGCSTINMGYRNNVNGLNYIYVNGTDNDIQADLMILTGHTAATSKWDDDKWAGNESKDGYEVLGSNNSAKIGIASGIADDVRTSLRVQGYNNTIGVTNNSAWGYIDVFGMNNKVQGLNDSLHICGNSNSASATKDVTAFGHSMNLCDISSTFVVDTNGNKFSSNKDGAYVNKVDTTTTNSGYSIVNINYIQSLVDRIVALENALKANNINI
ncbi:MAG: hypothetical protein MJZ34_08170 [Paludibacteraceae bacterium]|nr:hypothetical protein [Paludibacteraceae bacterium]